MKSSQMSSRGVKRRGNLIKIMRLLRGARNDKIGYWLLAIGLFLAQPALALTPNDPYYNQQWYLAKINAPTAWDTTTGSNEVIVAVLDTGVDLDHPDIAANLWINPRELSDGFDNDGNGFVDDIRGWNFVEKNNRPEPTATNSFSNAGLVHGTLLAGIIAAIGNNREGVAGISWHTTIMPVRVLNDAGDGRTEDIVAGIDYAVRNGADIINLSFTTFDNLPTVTEAIRRAKDAGVLVVAAAGNDDGTNLDTKSVYPICSDGPAGENWVLGVAATDKLDQKANFSNYGSLCVDVSAPGVEIFGAQFFDARTPDIKPYAGWWSGTSVATPMVSGVAALVRAIYPDISRSQLIDVLKRSATPIDNLNPLYRGGLGRGRLDASAAIARAIELKSQSPTVQFAISSDSGSPRVWLFDSNGTLSNSFLAYGSGFTGGVRVTTGDIDGDGVKEIITGAGPGGGPHLRIFDTNGNVKGQFFPFPITFRGGITVAAADLDSDHSAEIIVGSGKGASPTVKIFDGKGNLKSQFMAYAPNFTGGVEVTSGDIDGDGVFEIITAAGPGGGPHVRAFDYRGNVKGQLFAFENTYRGGVRLATADLDGDRKFEILASRGTVDSSEVRAFSSSGTLKNSFTAFVGAKTLLALGSYDRDHDNRSEILAASGGTSPELRAFSSIGALLSSFTLPAELKSSLRLATF